jgi:transcriptional regulator with XRE-family HTH domain
VTAGGGPLFALKMAIWRSGRRQWEIARSAGLSANVLSYIVQGRRAASAREQERIAGALGVPLRSLFGRQGRA